MLNNQNIEYFSEYGLFGFIDFSRSDLDNLGLYHLNQDSIRCEKCLMIKVIHYLVLTC